MSNAASARLDPERQGRRNAGMNRRSLLASLGLLPAPALAQSPPSRPIRILLGFAAGGNIATEATAFPQAETARWAPVIRASGARPD